MYIVNAVNHFKTVEFEEYYLERAYAIQMFNTATKCVDCACVALISATTGEILAEWPSKDGLTIY